VATQAGAQVTTYKSVNQYVQDLQNKRLDAIINDRMTMGYLIKSRNLPVKISSTGLVSRDVIGMAIKKNNADFVAAVNMALERDEACRQLQRHLPEVVRDRAGCILSAARP